MEPVGVQQVPVKQTIYPAVNVGVQRQPDGTRLLVISAPGEQLVFPMTAEAAETIGRALTAPSVAVAAGNGAGLH